MIFKHPVYNQYAGVLAVDIETYVNKRIHDNQFIELLSNNSSCAVIR